MKTRHAKATHRVAQNDGPKEAQKQHRPDLHNVRRTDPDQLDTALSGQAQADTVLTCMPSWRRNCNATLAFSSFMAKKRGFLFHRSFLPEMISSKLQSKTPSAKSRKSSIFDDAQLSDTPRKAEG